MACTNQVGALRLQSPVSQNAVGSRLSTSRALKARVLRQNKSSRSGRRLLCTATLAKNPTSTPQSLSLEVRYAATLHVHCCAARPTRIPAR
eukprot:5205498-Pyramimonas_sp.AAC.1